MSEPQAQDPVIAKAIEACPGKLLGLASGLGVTYQSIQQWRRIPAERVHEVERLTGIPRSKLRPDLYPPNREKRLRAA